MPLFWDKWDDLVQNEKDIFKEIENDIGREGKELMQILDKFRFIKNTCVLLAHAIMYVEKKKFNWQNADIRQLQDCIDDLEEAAREMESMTKQEYRFAHLMRKLAEKGKDMLQEVTKGNKYAWDGINKDLRDMTGG